MVDQRSAGESVDICFLLEGTYPYVRGGVSSWVHQMLTEAPGVTFGLFFIGSQREQSKEYHYDLPSNVKVVEEVFLYDAFSAEEREFPRLRGAVLEDLFESQSSIYLEVDQQLRVQHFWDWFDRLDQCVRKVTFGHLTRSPESWELIHRVVDRYLSEDPFTSIYYTWVYLHAPIWKLILARDKIPKAKAYHTLCTGYAGLAGSIASRRHGVPLLVSEHGVYVKERIEEINHARWIHDPGNGFPQVDAGLAPLKRAWVEMFTLLGMLAYHQAETVTTLFSRNRQLQIEMGCPAEKLKIIPNGVDPAPYDQAREERTQRLAKAAPRVVGFIGRVVSIKDVKTLIRAMGLVREQIPDVCLKLIGPTEEEPSYFDECLNLIELLDLENVVEIAGRQNVLDVISGIDVMVLTSISEGLPFVILEGYAAGIPTVATDVGSCRELIFGNDPDDRAIGASGRLTKIGSPESTAQGLVELLSNPETLKQSGEAGLERLNRFYLEEEVMDTYRNLYRDLIDQSGGKD
jgi:glycosyltransferase involved in cell wall biosynthesis